MAHIHVIPTDSEHWLRHIAFRDYLKAYPDVKAEYQKLKEELGKKEWEDGNEYNEAKMTLYRVKSKKQSAGIKKNNEGN